jgi:hypothetical protein
LKGSIDGWDIGIEIDGNKNVAQDFDANDNGTAGVKSSRAETTRSRASRPTTI